MADKIPKSAALVAIPLVLLAVAVVQRKRGGKTGTSVAVEKVAARIALKKPGELAKMTAKKPGTVAGVTAKVAQAKLAQVRVAQKKHKPKSLLRYYGISLLINALERERTRKAVIGGLRLAQRRA